MAISVMSSEMEQVSSNPAAPQDSLEADAGDSQRLAWITSRLAVRKAGQFHYILVLRFLLINTIGFALIGAAHMQGLVALVVASDQTYLSVVISLVFLCGLGICGAKVWNTSRELNQIKSFDPLRQSKASDYLVRIRGHSGESRGIIAAALRLKLTQRIALVRQVASSLVLMGLIGTVIGFIIALSGVKPDQAADVKAISPMVSTLISGMSTALYTTLVGSLLNIWLMANYHLLAGGTVKLISGLLEFGEDNAPA